MGSYDNIATPISGQPISSSAYGQAVKEAIDDLDARVGVIDLQPAWTPYTPVWTSSGTAPSLGNGTLTGAYRKLGSVVFVRVFLTLGSTTTIGTGLYRFSLPFGAVAGSLLPIMCKDNSASGRYSGTAEIINTLPTGDNMRIQADSNIGSVGSTIPFAWAVSDTFQMSGSYEAA